MIFFLLFTLSLSRSIGKCFMEMKMALCTDLATREADDDGGLGVEEYRDIVTCTIDLECP